MLRVLHINDKIEVSGGVEVYVYQLMELAPSYDITMDLIGLSRHDDDSLIVTEIDREQFVWDKHNWKSRLSERINNADILHLHSISDPELIRWLASRKPIVRSMHEPRMICPGQGKFWRFSETVCNKVYGFHCFKHAYTQGCCNRSPGRLLKSYRNVRFETTKAQKAYRSVIVMSEYMRKESVKAGISDSLLSLNPYFTPIVEPKSRYKHSVKKRLLFVGRLSLTKGVHYFIRLGIELLSKGFEVELHIIGDGMDRKQLESMVPEEYAADFHFKGWKNGDEIDSAIRDSYLVIFPSIYPEAFGIVGLEAMVRGIPVVGFDVGGVSTWLLDGITGYLVSPKNERMLFDKTVELLSNEVLYKRMSKECSRLVRKQFNPERHMLQLKKEYKKACNG